MTAIPPGVVRHLQIISDKQVDQLQAYKTIKQIVIPLYTIIYGANVSGKHNFV